MTRVFPLLVVLVAGCAAEPGYDPLDDYEELDRTTAVPTPSPGAGQVAPIDRDLVDRGRYMVELLGCGACHTDGAFEGAPDLDRALAGSGTGIARSNPLETEFPGVVYPPNITPDEETGIGLWSDYQIASAIRFGVRRHGDRPLMTMPWQGYNKMTRDDIDAIVAYLRSIPPIRNRVPTEVDPGQKATEPFVYFGVYRSRK